MPRADKSKTVTVISYNLARGSAISCSAVALALKPHYDVQLIGTLFGDSTWTGLDDLDVEVEVLRGCEFPAYLGVVRRMLSKIRGSVVIAHQLRFPSFGVGLLHKMRSGSPCTVYLDDDDLILTMPGRRQPWRRRLRNPIGDLPARAMYRLRSRADAFFCGSDFFSAQFGGITVPLGRDAAYYRPEEYNQNEIRAQLGIQPNEIVIGFMGNARPPVGIEDLISALEILNNGDHTLLVAPPGRVTDFGKELFARTSVRIRLIEDQPSSRVREFLAASDLVVVPQRTEDVSQGQLPARLVEAMAMAKPIITTRLADIPRLLEDGGIYVDERDPAQLAVAIEWMRTHRDEAAAMASKARRCFIEKLSVEAMGNRMIPELDRLLAKAER